MSLIFIIETVFLVTYDVRPNTSWRLEITTRASRVLCGLQTKLEETVILLNTTIELHLFEVFSKVMNIFVTFNINVLVFISKYQPTWCTTFYNKFISSLYMFRAHMLIVRRSKLYYTVSGTITPIGGRPVHRLCMGRPPIGVLIPETV